MNNTDTTTPQLKALNELAGAVTSHSVKNAEPLLSKDFICRAFPKVPELPDLTKEEYLQKYELLFTLFPKIEITHHEVIQAPGKIVIHHSFLFTAADGTDLNYDGVAIFSYIEEDGKIKFVDCKDFADSEKRGAFLAHAAKSLSKGSFAA